MNELIDFLLARIAEDETEAGHLLGREDDEANAYGKRFLAECKMKRDIIDWHPAHSDPQRMSWGTIIACSTCGDVDDSPTEWPCDTLKVVATVYSDHPDYRKEWVPAE